MSQEPTRRSRVKHFNAQSDNTNPIPSPYQKSENISSENISSNEKPQFAPPVTLTTTSQDASTPASLIPPTETIAPSKGYQVSQQSAEVKSSKKTLLWIIISIIVIALIAIGFLLLKPKETPSPTTAEPTQAPPVQQAFTPSNPIKIGTTTELAINSLINTDNYTSKYITSDQIIYADKKDDNLYDYYIFKQGNGKLLNYFENLPYNAIYPLENGGTYVKQAPYLLNSDGQPFINTAKIESGLQQPTTLSQYLNGWAIISAKDGLSHNFINEKSETLHSLWFSKAFPFTGNHTLAYADTGTDGDERYLLYILTNNGTDHMWRTSSTTDDVLLSANNYAFMKNGEIFDLETPDTVLTTATESILYADFNALVFKSSETNKYGLYVDSTLHYPAIYDKISPVESTLLWESETIGSASFSVMDTSLFPQPQACLFSLVEGDNEQFVSLSNKTPYPIAIEGALKGGLS